MSKEISMLDEVDEELSLSFLRLLCISRASQFQSRDRCGYSWQAFIEIALISHFIRARPGKGLQACVEADACTATHLPIGRFIFHNFGFLHDSRLACNFCPRQKKQAVTGLQDECVRRTHSRCPHAPSNLTVEAVFLPFAIACSRGVKHTHAHIRINL